MMATTKIFNYDLLADNDVKIRNEQLNAVARDYLRGFLKQLQYAGFIQPEVSQTDHSQSLAIHEQPSKLTAAEDQPKTKTINKEKIDQSIQNVSDLHSLIDSKVDQLNQEQDDQEEEGFTLEKERDASQLRSQQKS